jgi:hypothetical protein
MGRLNVTQSKLKKLKKYFLTKKLRLNAENISELQGNFIPQSQSIIKNIMTFQPTLFSCNMF